MQTIIGNDIDVAATLLKAGELVAIPTETVYGLAGNALDANAVVKIFEAKDRPHFNPLIVHCANWRVATQYVKHIPVKALVLAEKFSPGPLTFLLDKADAIPDIVTAGSSKVAIRIPNHPLTLSLLKALPFPLAAPSANPFGYISPTTADHVLMSLYGKIPYILNGGPCLVGVESTIIGFDENETVVLHRNGGISAEDIEAVLQEKVIVANKEPAELSPVTSGQLASHYAPHTPLYTGNVEVLMEVHKGKSIAVISFFKKYDAPDWQQFVLSPSGELAEAAKNLFATLRIIDTLKVDVIIAEIFPNERIGKAINDRLNRARADKK